MEKIYETLKIHKNNPCLITQNYSVTYSELIEIIEEYTCSLMKPQLVLLLFSQDKYCIALYLYCLIYNIPIMLLDKHAALDEIEEISKRFGVSHIAGSNITDNRYETCFSKTNFRILKSSYYGNISINPKIALMISTSGTLSGTKFVKLTLDNLICNTQQILDYLPINAESIAAPPPPLSYVYGLSVLNTHLARGGAVALNDESFLSRGYWDFFSSVPFTNINGVPYFYDIMKRFNGFNLLKCPPQFLTQAGGRLNEETRDYILSNIGNSQFFIMYGQAEATARMTYLLPNKLLTKKGSVGQAVKGGTISIKNGEVVYKGENVFNGYAQNAEDLKEIEKIDELHTGDEGYIDEDNFLFLTGRKARFVKILGKRVSLDACENILGKLGYECAITQQNEIVHVYIVGEVERRKIAQLLHIPFSLCVLHSVPALPRNNNGKIHYAKLLQKNN